MASKQYTTVIKQDLGMNASISGFLQNNSRNLYQLWLITTYGKLKSMEITTLNWINNVWTPVYSTSISCKFNNEKGLNHCCVQKVLCFCCCIKLYSCKVETIKLLSFEFP